MSNFVIFRNDTRPKRKRRHAPPQYEDFETFSDDPDSSTDQRKTRRKMAKLKNDSKSTHNKDCINEVIYSKINSTFLLSSVFVKLNFYFQDYLRRVNKKVNDGLVKHKHEILEVIEKDLQETSSKLAVRINCISYPLKAQEFTMY